MNPKIFINKFSHKIHRNLKMVSAKMKFCFSEGSETNKNDGGYNLE